MGGAAAPVSPSESVAGMVGVIDRLALADSGGFFAFDGSRIDW
jgi:hypothetical protein